METFNLIADAIGIAGGLIAIVITAVHTAMMRRHHPPANITRGIAIAEKLSILLVDNAE